MKMIRFLDATRFAAFATTALVCSTAAFATEVIRVDLQPNSGSWTRIDYTGVESQAATANSEFGSSGGNLWNHLSIHGYSDNTTNPSFSNLIDSAGHSTNVSFSITGAITSASDNPINTNGSNALQNDYFLVFSGHAVQYTIAGLSANTRIDFFNYAPNFTNRGNRGYNLTANGTAISVPNTSNNNTAFTSITSTATGTITGTFSSPTGEADWSGFQLAYSTAAVPEPTTWAMIIFGFGIVGGGLRRRSIKVALA